MTVPYLRKEHNPCRFCGGEMKKRDYESWKQFYARLTCSVECAHGARVAKMAKRPGKLAHRGGEVQRRQEQEQDRRNRDALEAQSRICQRPVFHPVSLRCNPGIVWLMQG